MAKIEKLCNTVGYKTYFKDIQKLGKFDLFSRFDDIENVVNKKIDEKYRHFLAQPVVEGDSITWFSKPYSETPRRLSEMPGEERIKYEHIKNDTLNHYKSVANRLKSEGKTSEAECLENATKFVNDDFVYCFDDKTVLGVWGMQLRNEVREPIGIAVKNQFIKRPPKLEVPPETPEQESPVPEKPQPEQKPPVEEKQDTEKEIEPPVNPFTVRFNAGENGHLNGVSELFKHNNEIITSNEIPEIQAKEGYEFTGWDKNPINYRVTGDTEFTAQYRKIPDIVVPTGKLPRWKGCLNWLLWLLLLLLLLLIFFVIWCGLLKKCNFDFCGCSENTTVVAPDPRVSPAPTPCNTVVKSGGYEGYVGSFNMGQQSGSFLFQYDTKNIPDKITIYDSAGTKGKVIYTYEGGTGNWVNAVVQFNEQTITVEVIGQKSGTVWEFKINCPAKNN